MQNKYIQLFLIYGLLVVKLGAAVIVTGAKTTSGATGQDVPGKFNESNAITITITLTDNQAAGGSNDMSDRNIAVHVGFSSSTSITPSISLEANSLSLTKTFGTNTHTYTITNTHLTDAFNAMPSDKYFDFNIRFSDGSADGYVDSNGDNATNASDIHAVDFNCDDQIPPGCDNTYLFYDRTDPTVTSVGYPASNNSKFNSKSFKYTLAQNLHETLTSTLTIEGDAGGTGLDNGETYTYPFDLNGVQRETGGESTIDVTSIFSPASGDGSRYNL